MVPRPPRPPLFPYTTLFRSVAAEPAEEGDDALAGQRLEAADGLRRIRFVIQNRQFQRQDRKSTRLNSSHPSTSYAVFCLKKKTETEAYVKPSLAHTCHPAIP